MKRNLKKCLVMLLVFATVITVFTGCGDKTSNNGVEKITVWTNAGATKQYMTEKIAKWNETVGKEKGIEIDYTVYGADYVNIYELAMENDQAPDILAISGDKKDFVATGKILPLSSMPGGKELIEESGSSVIQGVNKFGEDVYFFNSESNTIGLIYNVDLFKKAGLVDENGNATPPKTWDEVRAYAKKITDASDTAYGISFPFKWGSFYNWTIGHPFSASFVGTEIIDWDNLKIDMSNNIKALEWMRSIKQDGSYFPGVENMDNDTQRAQFAEGNIGMYFGASWDVGVLTTQFVSKCDWDVAPFPTFSEEEKYLQSASLGHSMCISKSAEDKDPEKLMEVYKLFYSPETAKELYAKGYVIPANPEYTKDVDLSNTPKQWISFGNLVAITRPSLPSPSLKVEGDNISDITAKVWAGTIKDIDAAVNDLSVRRSQALKEAVASGDIKREDYDFTGMYDFRRND